MAWLLGILVFLLVVDAILLTLLVLIQHGKGGGLATDIQAVAQASQILGVRQAPDMAEKLTWTLFGVLIGLTLLIHAVHSGMRGEGEATTTRTARVVETQPPMPAPAPTPSQPKE